MVLDPESIAMSTWWPHHLLDQRRNPDYSLILEELAVNPKAAAIIMEGELLKLMDMKAGLKRYGAPDAMLSHIAIRMHEPELVHDQLERLL